MNVGQFQYIEEWNDEDDLDVLPIHEDDQHEYKSSLTNDDQLSNKISIAASAFLNTGGCIFVAGINNETGKIDGGIPAIVGKRGSRLDWVAQQIMKTQPPVGPYLLRWIDKGASIKPNCGAPLVSVL